MQWDERNVAATVLGADKTGTMQILVDDMLSLGGRDRKAELEQVFPAH